MSNDGGPAFPRPAFYTAETNDTKHDHLAQGGMSLRDWFAGQALEGMAAKFEEGMAAIMDGPNPSRKRLDETASRFAGMVYATADAMLAARALPSGSGSSSPQAEPRSE